LVLLAVIVCLVMFDANKMLKTYVAPAPFRTTAASAAKTAVPDSGTEPRSTFVVAPSASALAPPEGPASKSPIAAPAPSPALAPLGSPAVQAPVASVSTPPLPDIEVIAPREGVTGNSIQVRVGIRGSPVERSAQIVLEYDVNALRVLEPEPVEQGRAEATLNSTGAGKEFGRVAFRFEVIVGEKQPTALMASATTFDASGNAVRTLGPAQQEIMLRP
jgi:hypothetical protein